MVRLRDIVADVLSRPAEAIAYIYETITPANDRQVQFFIHLPDGGRYQIVITRIR